MNDDDLDRLLSGKDDIVPSSGFTANVMDAVRREATAPGAIPFPWLRAIPLAIAALVAVATLAIALISYRGEPTIIPGPMPGQVMDAAWTGLALIVALVSAQLSMKLPRIR